MSPSVSIRRLGKYANYLVALILVLLPFHAVFTTWAGSNFGYIDAFRIWKELLMVPLGLVAAYIVWRDSGTWQELRSSWLAKAILIYTVLFVVYAAWAFGTNRVSPVAVAFSLVTNLRFVWFFLIVWIISRVDSFIIHEWQKILFAPAGVVVLFGLLQRFVLPPDVLRHVGYGPNTIPAVQTIDNKIEYQRIQATLRGANPLGAYLLFVITATVARIKRHKWLAIFLAATSVVLFYSYSRSAWIGLVVALAVFAWLQLATRRGRQIMVLSLLLAGLVTVGLTWQLQNNDTLQNTLFHSDENSTSQQSSNQARSNALTTAAQEVVRQPLGQGPGSAGPASFRNEVSPPRIAENYYLQIGQEVGIVGLAVFLLILVLVARNLLQRRRYVLAQILLASLAGLTVVNVLSHAWTDDTISLLWWGFAGAVMALPAILPKELKDEQKTKNIKKHKSQAI